MRVLGILLFVGSCSLTSDLGSLRGEARTDAGSDAAVGGSSGSSGGSGGSGGTSSNACQATCDRQAMADCPGFELAACMAFCEGAAAGVPTECSDQLAAFLVCTSTESSYVCGAGGFPQLINCQQEQASLDQCLTATPDAGGDGGDDCVNALEGQTCQAMSGTDTCTQCALLHCCEPIDTCFADQFCGGLYSCIMNQCANDPDIAQCVTDTCQPCTPGIELYNAMSDCVLVNCAGSCG